MTHQGRLFDAGGVPVTGAQGVTFTIYDLAEQTPLDEGVFDGSTRWLGITAGDDPEMTPRAAVVSMPYAVLKEPRARRAPRAPRVRKGAQGPAGPQGPSGIVASAYATGAAVAPPNIATCAFLGPQTTHLISATNQMVHVSSSVGLGAPALDHLVRRHPVNALVCGA